MLITDEMKAIVFEFLNTLYTQQGVTDLRTLETQLFNAYEVTPVEATRLVNEWLASVNKSQGLAD